MNHGHIWRGAFWTAESVNADPEAEACLTRSRLSKEASCG